MAARDEAGGSGGCALPPEAVRQEARAFLEELNRLYAPGEPQPQGYAAGGPNAPYLTFLRRRVQAMRADNLMLRREVERLTAETVRLTQHAEWLKSQATAHHLRCRDTILALTAARDELAEDLRQAKASRGWRFANWLGGVSRRLRFWRRGA